MWVEPTQRGSQNQKGDMRAIWVMSSLAWLVPEPAPASFLSASLFAQPDTTVTEKTAPPQDTRPNAGVSSNPEDSPQLEAGPGMPGSLFSGRVKGGMFAKIEPKVTPAPPPGQRYTFALRPGVVGLRDLIGRAEAGRANYDAVQHGARIKTPKRPTQMTIREIYDWIDATPGQPHAIGRYQFIPPTLRRVVRVTGIPETAYFTPQVQDALADVLFADAGIQNFLAGKITQTRFMNNLAKIWAGFPNSSGRSHYHGYAGNFATISWSEFQSAMDRIFPRG